MCEKRDITHISPYVPVLSFDSLEPESKAEKRENKNEEEKPSSHT